MASVLQIVLDADGNSSDSRVYAWDFSNYPELATGGDSLLASPVPVITQIAPPGQPSLTIGTPQVTGPLPAMGITVAAVLARVYVVGGAVGCKYLTSCKVQTAQGDTLERLGDFRLVGPD